MYVYLYLRCDPPVLPLSPWRNIALCDSEPTFDHSWSKVRQPEEEPTQDENTPQRNHEELLKDLKTQHGDFPGSPVVKAFHSQCMGHNVNPWLGN